MGEKTQVHVQVEEDTKREWKKAVKKDRELTSLSDLIRRAVFREISDDNRVTAFDDVLEDRDIPTQTDGDSETATEMAKLRDTIEDMDSRLEEVRRVVTADTERRPLEDRIMEALPPAKPHTKQWKRVKRKRNDPNPPAAVMATAWDGDIWEISKHVGESPQTVEERLDEMGVPRGDVDGERRYWMEGQA
jgi:hypothetical protein